MRRRTLVGLASVALGIAACVDVPNNMRAQFAPAGPNDRSNFRAGSHGTAPPNTPAPMLPWDAGGDTTPDASVPVVSDDASAPAPASSTDGGVG